MARVKYNHSQMMESFNQIPIRGIKSGMICQFSYMIKTAFDRNPLILFLYRDIKANPRLIHGVNLNYLNRTNFKELIRKINQTNPVITESPTAGEAVDISYTRVSFKHIIGESSKAEMDMFYNSVLKIIPQANIGKTYRVYKENSMTNLKVVKLKL